MSFKKVDSANLKLVIVFEGKTGHFVIQTKVIAWSQKNGNMLSYAFS